MDLHRFGSRIQVRTTLTPALSTSRPFRRFTRGVRWESVSAMRSGASSSSAGVGIDRYATHATKLTSGAAPLRGRRGTSYDKSRLGGEHVPELFSRRAAEHAAKVACSLAVIVSGWSHRRSFLR